MMRALLGSDGKGVRVQRGFERQAMASDEIQRIEAVYAEYDRAGRWTTPSRGRQLIEAERTASLRMLLSTALPKPLPECRVLDLGCGGGQLLKWFHDWGAAAENLLGVDLLAASVEAARQRYPGMRFSQGNAEALDLPDASMDVVCAFTVFSSILDDTTARNVARTITRVLAPRGTIVWYDLRYPSPYNPHVRAMTIRRIRALFPGAVTDLRPITLVPPLADRLGPMTELLYPALVRIPGLRSHWFGSLRVS